MAGKRGMTDRGLAWELMNSWWIAPSFLGFSWVGFLYIGKKARQKKWVILGFVFMVLQLSIPMGELIEDQRLFEVLIGVWGVVYVVGIVLSFLFRKEYLMRRDIVLNAHLDEIDQQNMRAAMEESYRKQGVAVRRTKTSPAKEASRAGEAEAVRKPVGVPESPAAPAAKKELLDINSCPESELAKLPGVSVVLAKRAAEYRESHGGFSSVDEFYRELSLKPHFVAQIDGKIVCGARSGNADKPGDGISKKGGGRRLDF